MLFAFVMFCMSFIGIVFLFALKHWEIRKETVLLPVLRQKVDMRANQLKELLAAARIDLSKLPPEGLRLSRIAIHEAALAFAAFARMTERRAHQVADLVSYRHRFEKRETRSEFLKKVAEHKSGGEEERDSSL